MGRATAAILLIGNELLSGKVRDVNAFHLAGRLFEMGIVLRRAVVVPDETAAVVEALRDLLGRVDYVFTSGGIGPTHDDITMAAVAQALGRELSPHPALVERVREVFGPDLGEEHLRMARVPEGCELVESEAVRFPVIAVDRVFVLAGVPEIFRRGLETVRSRLRTAPADRVVSIYLQLDEWSLTPSLDRTVAAFPDVAVGSYPELSNREYRVRVTLEGGDPDRVAAAADHLVDALPEGALVRREEL